MASPRFDIFTTEASWFPAIGCAMGSLVRVSVTAGMKERKSVSDRMIISPLAPRVPVFQIDRA